MMNKHLPETPLPKMSRWTKAPVPSGCEPWINDAASNFDPELTTPRLQEHLSRLANRGSWQWPTQPIHFVSDAHADARALIESLAMADIVKQTGRSSKDFTLTKNGKRSRIIIGGDCLDKGPSNLKLLDAISKLQKKGADLILLAGNHDLRLYLGLHCFSHPVDVFSEHLFVRMGAKTMPLLAEIWKRCLAERKHALRDIPDKRSCRQRLLPMENWAERFRDAAKSHMPEAALEREINRINEKAAAFKEIHKAHGLGIRKVYAAAQEAHRLFVTSGGQYAWFLRSLKLVWQEGSFVFVHAGFDDETARLLSESTPPAINAAFSKQFEENPFGFYASSLGNTLRTKYRPVDYPLTEKGVEAAHAAKVYAVVHGHRSHQAGQRLALRSGLLHIEGDVTLDRNTRKREGLEHRGAGVTSIRPDGQLLGMSADYPKIKVLCPELPLG